MSQTEKEKEIAKEAYLAYLEKLDLKPGDIVKVIDHVTDRMGGWQNEWQSYKNEYVGKEAEVLESCNPILYGINLQIRGHASGHFPVFCLEVVSRKTDEKVVQIEGQEFSEATIKAALKEYACWKE